MLNIIQFIIFIIYNMLLLSIKSEFDFLRMKKLTINHKKQVCETDIMYYYMN